MFKKEEKRKKRVALINNIDDICTFDMGNTPTPIEGNPQMMFRKFL